jgi:hypothetical protein
MSNRKNIAVLAKDDTIKNYEPYYLPNYTAVELHHKKPILYVPFDAGRHHNHLILPNPHTSLKLAFLPDKGGFWGHQGMDG